MIQREVIIIRRSINEKFYIKVKEISLNRSGSIKTAVGKIEKIQFQKKL